MYKKILALALAVLMLLGCTVTSFAAGTVFTISKAEDLKLLAEHPDATFDVVCDIDFGGKTWTAVGTEAKPFTGTINGNGYEISNIKFADATVMGFIGYNAGTIDQLNIFEYTADSTKAQLFGGFVAVNNGTISKCTTTLGSAKITAPKDAKIGQITAINNGTIENMTAAIDITVSAKSGAQIGGLTGVNTGTISKSEAAGRMILTGKVTAGLLIADAQSGSLAKSSSFTGSMATMNGELMKTMLPTTNKSACLKSCLWRDNTSSMELLPEQAQETRQKVLDYATDTATIVWHIIKDIDYPEPDSDNSGGGHSKFYRQGEIWYGMEYSHRGKNFGTVAYSIDENDNLKDFLESGPDGIDIYMSNDCSGFMVTCLQVVSPSYHATNTRNLLPGTEVPGCGPNSALPVGYVVTDKARSSGQFSDVYKSNSLETMKEAWAQALPGDGGDSSTGGHARLFVGSKIMRDENNIIDTKNTIIYMTGMGDGITRKIYHQDIEVYGAYTLKELLDNEWAPLTTPELKAGVAPEAKVTVTDTGAKDRAHICQGVFHSNYAVWGSRMQILDSKGKVVWEHTLWERVYNYNQGGNFRGRHSYYEFDLSRFATSFATADLTEGTQYTVNVTALLADRGEYPVKNYTFEY